MSNADEGLYISDKPPTLVRLCGALIRALREFSWRAKITPAMRERCVRYALDGGAKAGWELGREADRIAEYIARGKH